MIDELDVMQGAEVDVFDTGSLPVPPSEPDAHQATIEGAKSVTFDSGATAIEIGLRATDTPGLDTQMRIFVPKLFVQDINVPKAELPEEKDNNQRFQYRSSIQNDDGTATVQELLAIAKEAGRSASSLGLTRPTNFDHYVANLNAMLTGLEVIIVRRPGKEEYKNRLEVRRIYSRSILENPGNKLKGLRLGWE